MKYGFLRTWERVCRALLRFESTHQRFDPVRKSLSRLAKLRHSPVGRVAFCDIVRARMVDQSLGQRRRQDEFALGDGDKTVPQAV